MFKVQNCKQCKMSRASGFWGLWVTRDQVPLPFSNFIPKNDEDYMNSVKSTKLLNTQINTDFLTINRFSCYYYSKLHAFSGNHIKTVF